MPKAELTTYPLPPKASKNKSEWKLPEDLTRHIPSNILQMTNKHDGIMPNDKFLMSLYWALSKNSGTCSITDSRASKMLNLPIDSISKSRRKLISLKKITIDKKQIKIHLPELRPGVLVGGRTVRDCFMRAFKDAGQRLVAETEICKENKYVGWRAWHLGMSKIAYQKAKQGWNETGELRIIINAYETEKTRRFYTPKQGDFIPQNKEILYPIRKDPGKIKESNNLSGYKGAAPQEAQFNPSIMEDSMQTVQTNVFQEINYKNYLKKGVSPLKKYPPIPEDIMIELQEEAFQHKHITSNKTEKQLNDAAQVVKALRHKNGLASILDEGQIELIIRTMSSSLNRLHPEAVRQALHKQFSDMERIELYKRLSNSMSKSFQHGNGGNISLMNAVWPYGAKGFCRLVKVWLNPPQPLRPAYPTVKCPPDLERPLARVLEEIPRANRNVTINILKDTKAHYDTNILPKERKFLPSTPTFNSFLSRFLEWGYNKSTDRWSLNISWLKPSGPMLREWEAGYLAEIEKDAEIRANGARRQAHSEMLDLIARIEDEIDTYGEEYALERHPADLVERASRNLNAT